MKTKKSQTDLSTFVIIAIALLFLAPVALKIVNETLDGFSTALNETDPTASENVDYIHSTFVNFWDYLIILGFFSLVVLLFISSFLADTHPLFLIVYIFSAMLLIMFSPYMLEPVKEILGMTEFSDELGQIPLTSFMIQKFNLILLGLIVVTGIIMYAKFRGRNSDL